MANSIYLLQQDGGLVRIIEQPYDSEALLQRLLAEYPDLLSGSQDTDEPRRWLLVRREAPIPVDEGGAGYFALDHLFLDHEGIPTLVEVKRSSDTRLRREVVGQMLDYAANAVAYWPAESLRAAFESRCGEGEAEIEFARCLGDDIDYESFWQTVKTNLLAKHIRLIFVADRIPAELRRIIEFLNETMDPVEILGIEVAQYVGRGQQQALVPRTIGRTADAQSRKGMPSSSRTNREEFLSHWEGRGREVYERLLDLANENGLFIKWGTKGFSMNVVIERQNISLLAGYPPPLATYLRLWVILEKVRNAESIASFYTEEALKIPSAEKLSDKHLRCPVWELSDKEEAHLHRTLLAVAEKIREHGLAPEE
jgi:hypothetical protein